MMIAPSGILTRRRLIYLVRTETRLSKAKATEAVNALLAHIADYMKAGHVVHFRGLGTFTPVMRSARVKWNPRCGELLPDGSPNQYFVPAHYRIRFAPCPEVRLAVRQTMPVPVRTLTEEQRVRMITSYLETVHYASTIAIAGAAGLPVPTVQKVLKRHECFRYSQSRWHLCQ